MGKVKYVEVLADKYGNWIVDFASDSLHEYEDRIGMIEDKEELLKRKRYPYEFTVRVPRNGDINNREYMAKRKIIYALPGLTHMVGMTVEQAMKEIAIENAKGILKEYT